MCVCICVAIIQVLHWLASMTVGDIALRLMPMLVQSAITLLMQHGHLLVSLSLPFAAHFTLVRHSIAVVHI